MEILKTYRDIIGDQYNVKSEPKNIKCQIYESVFGNVEDMKTRLKTLLSKDFLKVCSSNPWG